MEEDTEVFKNDKKVNLLPKIKSLQSKPPLRYSLLNYSLIALKTSNLVDFSVAWEMTSTSIFKDL